MTSSAKWLLALLSPLLLAARAAEAPVSRNLANRVAQRIADSWRVPVSQVRLSWGHLSSRNAPADTAAFRLLGRGEGGWYVVVFDPEDPNAAAVRLRAGVERPVMVAARALPAGAKLAEGDMREEIRVHWGVPSPDSAIAAAAGWEVRRALRPGDALVEPAVAAPPFVVAGQPVRLEWRSGGVEVSLMGIALNSARQGERIRARLEERPASLTATVTAPGIAVLANGGAR